MNGADDLARRIMRRLTEPQESNVTTVIDESGQAWLHFRAPQIAPGDPPVLFTIPDNGREPRVTFCLPVKDREPHALDS